MKKLLLIVWILVLTGLFLLNDNKQSNATPVQDRYMKIIVCSCGNDTYAEGFSCYYGGNDCYYSRYCFCENANGNQIH